jgi:glycine/D-amino acid oxidase-like deaminating enzyme
MIPKKIDYLIIGQGLAGSLLAWELLGRQKKVIIVDDAKENASLMAAGLINPVTGMRLVKSTEVDILLPFAIDYYHQLSTYFKQTFYIEQTMLRILSNEKELLVSQKRLQQPGYQAYLADIIPSNNLMQSSFGLLKQKKTGYLLTRPLLSSLKNHFISINAYVHSELKYNDIVLTPSLQWKTIQPKQIIFCQGHFGATNPWFSALPFRPVKGEIITAKAAQAIPQTMLNFGHWFIPLSTNQFRLGATFDRENLNTIITTNAKETLLKSLKQVYPDLLINSFCSHQAGIRPATLDKQPFIGSHAVHPGLVIFNGFGAKGSLQIPWYCKMLANHLLTKQAIPGVCNIQRYSGENEANNR